MNLIFRLRRNAFFYTTFPKMYCYQLLLSIQIKKNKKACMCVCVRVTDLCFRRQRIRKFGTKIRFDSFTCPDNSTSEFFLN